MVDLDIGTESMRWMGDTRFMIGFLKGIASNKNFQCRLRMKVVESDKVEMARAAREIALSARGKQAVGGGTDPLVNETKKMDLNGKTAGESSKGKQAKDVAGSSSRPIEQATNPSDRPARPDDHGPLPDAEPLNPDETWTTIESAQKGSATTVKSRSEASDQGAMGTWVDGEGILYA